MFEKVCEPNALGELIAQGSNNRLHRKCRGCCRVIKSCTVQAGEEHLLICQKTATCFPNVRTVIQRSRANKGDAKLPALLKRQHEQAAITSAAVPVPKDQEAVSIDAALLDMLVMCNVSFNTVDSAWFRRFCGTIRPGFVPLCASTMRTTALDNKHAKVCIGIKQLLKAIKFPLLSTLTLDGWTNINGASVWVIIAVLPGIGAGTLRTKAASADSHKAEWISGMTLYICDMLQHVIPWLIMGC
ncbi:TPA: hypothetical protein ACH3X1_003519 [Trebouxia sp. C0004]